MSTRNKTIAGFFTVAMAAMLFGAVVGNQVPRSSALEARAAEPGPAQAPSRLDPGSFGLNTFRDIARRANPAVVNINTSQVVNRSRRGDPYRDFFGDDLMDRFFGPQPQQPEGRGGRPQRQTTTSLGSGFIIDKDGLILTNRHVVEGADKINVTLYDDRNGNKRYEAKLVGKDARTDVALLKIEPKETLTPVELGDSEGVEAGEWVMAIGNPFGLGGNSVTVGVVSYKGRGLTLGVLGTSVDMIQTDAAINPGNSGGPLLNARGQVVGINTMIITGGERQSAGVGFSVPINVAKEILPQLRDKGRVARGWLGISIRGVTEDLAKTFKMKDARGALVSEVTANSPAAKAGIEIEDVIVSADGREIVDNGDLSRYIASQAPGKTVKLEVLRGGATKTISVTLGTFPDDPSEAAENQEDETTRLGMTLRDLTPEIAERLELPRGTRGAVVTDVEAGEAADTAGLQPRDVIVGVNGTACASVAEFQKLIDAAKADGVARLRVRSTGGHRFVVLKLS
ncbi:MAG TPA: Do family serine endopeptidase [Vicinamibacteria bacterium]